MTAPTRRPRTARVLTYEQALMREARAMREDPTLREHVRRAAKGLPVLAYHPWTSINSAAGFLDWTFLAPRWGTFMVRETKAQGKKLTPAQQKWYDGWKAVGADVGLWEPIDWLTGRIQRELGDLANGQRGSRVR